jgi:hypothetical protein
LTADVEAVIDGIFAPLANWRSANTMVEEHSGTGGAF